MPNHVTTEAVFSTTDINDEALTRRISHALDSTITNRFWGSPVHIQVNDGVVTLRGVAATYSAKMQALQVVWHVPGVRQVCDRLWV